MIGKKDSGGKKKVRQGYTEVDDDGKTGRRVTKMRITPKKGAMGYTTITRGVKGASVGRKTTITNDAMTVRPSIGSGLKKASGMKARKVAPRPATKPAPVMATSPLKKMKPKSYRASSR